MAQASFDFFKLPFRAFGVELRPEAFTGSIQAIDLVNGHHVEFSFPHTGLLLFGASQHEDSVGLAVEGMVGYLKRGDTDMVLYNNRWKPAVIAHSWTEFADKLEPLFRDEPGIQFEPDDPFYMSEACYAANCEALFRFMRYVDKGNGNFEDHYRLVRPPFHATNREEFSLT